MQTNIGIKKPAAEDDSRIDLSESTLAAIRFAQAIMEEVVSQPVILLADIRCGKIKIRQEAKTDWPPRLRTVKIKAIVASASDSSGTGTKFRLELIHYMTDPSRTHWELAPSGSYVRYLYDNIRAVEFDGHEISVKLLADKEERELPFNLR